MFPPPSWSHFPKALAINSKQKSHQRGGACSWAPSLPVWWKSHLPRSPVCRWAPQLRQVSLGPPHCPGPSCPPAFAPGDNRGKQPNLISSPTGSFYSSFHGNSYFNVSKEGGARFFKKMIVEKLSWACVSCNGGFHGQFKRKSNFKQVSFWQNFIKFPLISSNTAFFDILKESFN